ncbi:transcription-repair coupling factor [Clostridium senegalense]|uniref:Transcription-repair-coupling factor n=1 Tax=Clostridium senegalense TaxID=1465809 RepID=A0A6M0H6Q9_9CLOT|nr:transcription-repair coupling factor [Clostridium senegalense]NEU05683.1 transcription-repair coupling factor [Clostridium senegalense]
MRLNGIMSPLRNSKEFKEISKSIENNRFPIGVYGLSESSKSYLINAVYENVNEKILILTHSDVEAKNIYEDLNLYIDKVFYFPSKEVVFYNADAISGDVRWERLKILSNIIKNKSQVIVAPIDAIIGLYTPVDMFKKYIFSLRVGKVVDMTELTEKLIQCGYERCDMVESKGQFSIRGGILDVFPPVGAYPYRIEWFDDEIDSIRTFNVDSQRSIEKVKTVNIFPAKEIITDEESIKFAYEQIEKDFTESMKNFEKNKNFDASERLNAIISGNLEALKETWTFETIDSYTPYFYKTMSTLLDYIGNCFILVDDVQRCNGKLESVYFEFEQNYETFLKRGNILPKQAQLLMSKEEAIDILENEKVITLDAIAKSHKILKPRTISSFSQITISDYHGQLDLLIDDIREKKKNGYRILILSGTRTRGERLIQTLRDREIEAVYKDIVDNIELGQVVVTFGNLLKGFECPDLKVCVISDKEVFGQSKRKSSVKRKNVKGASKIKSFTELKLGDYVVHANHGVGVYKGIKQLEVQGHKKDFLELSYNNGDTLYVPAEQLDLVQKYIGSEGSPPKVNKLGGSEWIKAKTKVKKSIEDIAEDLVKLYATRAQIKGHKFGKDTVWQKQFEDEFPFQETPDQLTSIDDIKMDMESDKPMDRLLCGDVGYGKTEVALRAAFKCVMEGKQVAFLVPTTILAQQHYKNMVKRFSDFPLKVDMVSRFRTSGQIKETLKKLKEGNVDILVGTHRLLQKDVQFKDLGLLVVDEEQRFGVTHKEKIKNLKKNVEVLTLSATPIPRTLHMSLTGVRDISVIETPPEDRYPVQTYVVEFNEQLIRDAIMRELNRDGQILFVYNRVETIKDMAAYLQKLVPEARIGIGHGQMTEKELEKVILDFTDYKYDMLVCTTIIETGIDIQNANTMIIYDADRMGLSQLYQLRGRVGRSNRIAYAYFTYTKDKVLTEVAEKRLKAIKDFTELGSGFKIAMRDLEIRGAGNIMGSSQHGHMAVVGYDLYCRMLEDSIKLIKGDIENEPIETTVDLKIDAFIPSNYIVDETQKIEVYKKIASIDSYDYMMELQEEIEDRFSDIPPTVYNLMNIAYLKFLAKEVGIIEIKEVKKEVVLTFENKKYLTQNILNGILDKYIKKINFKIGETPGMSYKIIEDKKEKLLDNLIELVKFMQSLNEKK